MVPLNQNQFSQTPVKGQLTMSLSPSTLAVQVGPDVALESALVPAQAFTIIDSAGGIPKIQPATADTDAVYGFANFTIKQSLFKAGQVLEASLFRGNIMYMEASAAIARGAKVMIVVSGSKVATATTGKTIIGSALDKASADGDLIRVEIDLPGALA